MLKVEIEIKPGLKEPNMIIYTDEITKEIQQLADRVSHTQNKILTGIRDQKIFLLNPEDIYCFYSENQKVFAKLERETLWVKLKLYELEEMFGGTSYVRVSNSCIVNIDKIRNLELSYSGTIEINFKNGEKEFVSRRFVPKIKKYLGI